MSHLLSQRRTASYGLALAVVLSGCGGGVQGPILSPVRGTVTLDGQPLPKARVIFQPSGASASPSIGETDDTGAFELAFSRRNKGALPGDHVVRITTAGVVTDAAGKETVVEEKVPPRYNEKTELKYQVKPEANQFAIRLESKSTAKK